MDAFGAGAGTEPTPALIGAPEAPTALLPLLGSAPAPMSAGA